MVFVLLMCLACSRHEIAPLYGSSVLQPDMSIRLIALKHCRESMADGDANLALGAVKKAKDAGLNIKAVGNHYINKNGVGMQVKFIDFNSDLPKLRDFVTKEMKTEATPGDTLIIFTIGHGMPDGTLVGLGQRADVMKALADAADENDQRTLWWQLSCHAAARLPDIKSLSVNQQRVFSVLASSTAQDTSAAFVQGKIMETVFMALARKDKSIDPDGDGMITAQEFRNFLNASGSRKGDLLFVSSMENPIFGFDDWANRIPIVNRIVPQDFFPTSKIPYPK